MTVQLRRLLPLCVSIVVFAAAAPARADDPPPQRESARPMNERPMNQRPQRQERGDLSDSIRRVTRGTGEVRVLSAERMQSDGREINRIKVMDERGRVRVLVDDPQQRPQQRQQRPAPRQPRSDEPR